MLTLPASATSRRLVKLRLALRGLLPSLAALLVALLVGMGGEYGIRIEQRRIEQDRRNQVISTLGQYRALLEGELNATLYLANGLIAYVKTHNQLETDTLLPMLKVLFEQGRFVRNIGLAPGNRLTYVYPTQGNEKAIGLYYPAMPDQWPAVEQAIRDRQPRLAGPVQLKQGGVGFIYRVPIFVGAKEDYWGLLSMVIDQETLFARVGMAAKMGELQLALRGRDGAGEKGDTFLGEAGLFQADAVTTTLHTPGGTWQLAGKPISGWTTAPRLGWIRTGAWSAGLLLGLGFYFFLMAVLERLQAEAAIKHSRDELRETQRIAMIGSWMLTWPELHFSCSEETFRIFQISPATFGGDYQAFLAALPGEHREEVDQDFQASVSQCTTFDKLVHLRFANGHAKQVRLCCETVYDEEGHPRLTRGTAQDVSHIREMEERLELSLRGANLASTDWDIAQDRLTFGTGWQPLLGYTPSILPRHFTTIAALVHPDDAPQARAELVRHLKGETDIFEVEIRMRHRNNHWIWVLVRGMVVERNAQGRALHVAGIVMDIGRRKEAEAQITRLSQQNELLLNSAGEGIFGLNRDGICTFINPAALAACGYEQHEVLGKPPQQLFYPETAGPTEACPILDTLRDGVRRTGEARFQRKHGSAFPVQITSTPIHEQDRLVGAVILFQDISRRKAMEQELMHLATTDSLTGIANRRHFLERLELGMARARRQSEPATLMMMDIDHFKCVNDSHGHAIGDSVLRHFTDLTRHRLHGDALFGRLGGEEFAIFLPSAGAEEAFLFADRLRRYVADTPTQTGHGEIPITISIGLSELSHTDSSPDELLIRADIALYQAKESGRNQVITG